MPEQVDLQRLANQAPPVPGPGAPPPNLPQQKPQIWRQILSGALLGLGAGMAAERPEQAFGAGQQAVMRQEDRQLQRRLAMEQAQREQERLGFEKQRVGIEQQRADFEQAQGIEQRKMWEAQSAFATANAVHLKKLTDLLPVEEARKVYETWTQGINATGLIPEIEFDPADASAFIQKLQSEGKSPADVGVRFGPSVSNPDKIAMYRFDPAKRLDKETAARLSKSYGLDFPEGMPTSAAWDTIQRKVTSDGMIKAAQLQFQRELQVARLQLGLRIPTNISIKLAGLDDQEAQYKTLLALFDVKADMNPEMRGKIGDYFVKGHPWVGGALSGAGNIKGTWRSMWNAASPEEASFRTLVDRIKAIQIHENYGGAVTPNELKLALSWVPSLGMPPTKFRAALVAQIKLTQTARQNLLASLPGTANPPSAPATQTPPALGEVKKFPNGTSGVWNGSIWVQVNNATE